MVRAAPMHDTNPKRTRPSGFERGAGTGWLERNESELTILGPLVIGIVAASYGSISGKLTTAGSLAAGWALWQLSMIVVVMWVVANTADDPEDVERMRLGYKPARPRQELDGD
jgi:hypothetical protein